MKKYFYFYDLNEVLIDRYPAKIATFISRTADTNNFVFIYSEQYKYRIPQNIPEGSMSFYIKDLSKKKIDSIVSEFPPISLTTIAQRIPDMWMLTYFNNLGYPTFTVQHGLWSDKAVRIPFIPLIYGKLSKFINYIKHVHSVCKLNKIPLFPTLIDLYRFWLVENIGFPETKCLHNDFLRATKVFAFDESWNDYYVNKYGYKLKDLIYIGNPDLLLLKNKDLNNKEDAVCYICQSLVEDGRYELTEYIKFLNILKTIVAENKKLYIKLHPRTKPEFYKIFEGNENIIFTNDLPICKYYIGHYTSLLATVKQISDNVLIWELPDHHTPEYFFQFASIVTNKEDDLKDFIQGKIIPSPMQTIKKLSYKELADFDPIKTIVDTLLKTAE